MPGATFSVSLRPEDQGAQKLPPIFQARLISDLTQGLIDQTPGVFDGLRG